MKNPVSKPPAATNPAARTILVLVRHGDAGDALASPERDALRSLTPKGRKQAKRLGKALVRIGLAPRDVWTSRLARAQETARTAIEAAHVAPPVTPTAALAPESIPERIVRALADTPPPPLPAPTPAKPSPRGKTRRRKARRPVEAPPVVRWIVGHEPHLSRLAAFAVGAPADSIRLPKGAFALVAFDGRGLAEGTGVLTGLVDPDVLKAVRSDRRR